MSKSWNSRVLLGIVGLLLTLPAFAGVTGGASTVNINVTTSTVEQTEVNEVVNDVILENLWHIMGEVERRNVWKKASAEAKIPKFWEVEVLVSDSEFATALADVKQQLFDLSNVPARRNEYRVLQDEQTGERLDLVSQNYEETVTDQTSEFNESVDANGAQFGVDYIGDPGNYLTWVAIGPNDVNVDVNQVTTNTTFVDAVTTNEYNQVAIWQVSALRTISPLVLDMDGDGAIQASGGNWLPHREVARDQMVFFDFYGDKFPVLMEWTGPQDGILCQPGPNGEINGTHLFGTANGFKNGYEALRTKDANGDGKISGEELKGLAIWMDANSDARAQKPEVKSLEAHGITELSVRHKDFVSSYVANGETRRMYDWWPQIYEINRIKISPKKV